jgi:hypothetical protein
MKFRTFSTCVLACACWLVVSAHGGAVRAAQDDKSAQAAPKVSSGERDAADKINKAKGAEAKLQAGAEFVRKYPKSALRPQVAASVAGEINGATDNNLKISLAQTYLDFFKEPGEAELVNATLLNAYINTGRTEDALRSGSAWLEKHPDDIETLQNLTILASAAAIKGNDAFITQGRQYGAKAIELLEADKRPESIDAAKWPDFKSATLVSLYRETSVLAYKAGDKKAALPLLEKAAALKSSDPGVYLLLSELSNDEYELLAKQYQVAAAPEKQAALKKVEAALDKVIEAYAQAVAVTEGNSQYQQANTVLREDLEKYYKYRHGGSSDGLKQLMDKYKRPATP